MPVGQVLGGTGSVVVLADLDRLLALDSLADAFCEKASEVLQRADLVGGERVQHVSPDRPDVAGAACSTVSQPASVRMARV